jgi:hypothetical protein
MSDLVQRLRDAHSMALQADYGRAQAALYKEAADEIERLQSLAGAVTPGQSVADIKEYLRGLPKKETDQLASNAGERTAP